MAIIELLAKNEDFRKLVVLHASLRKFGGRSGLRTAQLLSVHSGTRVRHFVPIEQIHLVLDDSLRRFRTTLEGARDITVMAEAAAELWHHLVTIYPFAEGNTATARAYLENSLIEKGAEIFTFDLINRHTFLEDPHKNIEALKSLFIISVRVMSAEPTTFENDKSPL